MPRIGNELYGGGNSPWASAVSNLGMALFGDPTEAQRRDAVAQNMAAQKLQMEQAQLAIDAARMENERRQQRTDYWAKSALFNPPAATATATLPAPIPMTQTDTSAPAASSDPAAPTDPNADIATQALHMGDVNFVPEPPPAQIDQQPLGFPTPTPPHTPTPTAPASQPFMLFPEPQQMTTLDEGSPAAGAAKTPYGGLEFGGNEFGGNTFGGNTFGGETYGGNTFGGHRFGASAEVAPPEAPSPEAPPPVVTQQPMPPHTPTPSYPLPPPLKPEASVDAAAPAQSPYGGATFGGNKFGGETYGGATFGGNKFGASAGDQSSAAPVIWGPHAPPDQYQPIIIAAAQKFNVPPALLAEQLFKESSFRATNSDGTPLLGPDIPSMPGVHASGIAQFIPSTAARMVNPLTGKMGIDPNDPEQAIWAQAELLDQLRTQHGGDMRMALADYGGAKSPDKIAAYADPLLAYYDQPPGGADTMAGGSGQDNVPGGSGTDTLQPPAATVQGQDQGPAWESILPAAGSPDATGEATGADPYAPIPAADQSASASAEDIGAAGPADTGAAQQPQQPALGLNSTPEDILASLDDYDKAQIKLAYDMGGPDAADKALMAAIEAKQKRSYTVQDAAAKSAEGATETERWQKAIEDGVTNKSTDTLAYAQAYNKLYEQGHWQMVTEIVDGREVPTEKYVPPVVPQGIPKPTYGGANAPAATPDAAAAANAAATSTPAAPVTSTATPAAGVTTTDSSGVRSTPLSAGKEQSLTDSENKTTSFTTRMKFANKSLDDLTAKGADVGSWSNYVLDKGGEAAANLFRGDVDKAAYAAAEQFVASINYHDSGAQISADEWARAFRDYLPQPGDGPTARAQKAAQRKVAILSFYNQLPERGRNIVDQTLQQMDAPPAATTGNTAVTQPDQPKPTNVPSAQNFQHRASLNGRTIYSIDGSSWFDDSGQQVQ